MAANPMMKYTFEIFDQVTKAVTKEDKIAVLQRHSTDAVKNVLVGTFDESVNWLLPDGSPPYTPAEERSVPSNFIRKLNDLRFFVKGGPGEHEAKFKREARFVRLLESIHPKDAEMVLRMVAKQPPAEGLTKEIVKEVFPNLIRK